MKVGSLFSGIGGFDLAFERAGFGVAFQCEIDRHALRVLEERWPTVRRTGDVREVGAHDGPVDVLVGGFPCQDLSVAGRRAGLAGERSGLFHEFARCIAALAPRWVVIENVPGLLSSNGGRDMATVLGTLGELGYGWAYRVLDAQYFGVAQRRRRVFIVGCAGGRTEFAAAVLFETESVRRDSPPRRETREAVAGTLGGGAQSGGFRTTDLDNNGAYVISRRGRPGGVADELEYDLAPALRAGDGGSSRGLMVANATLRAEYGEKAFRGDGSDNLIVGTLTAPPKGAETGNRAVDAGHLIAVIQDARGVRDKAQNGIGIAEEGPMYTLDGTSQHAVAVADPISASEGRTWSHGGNNAGQTHNMVLSGDGTSRVPAMTAKWAKGSGGPAGDECANLAFVPASVETLAGGAHPGGLNGQEAETQTVAPAGRVRRLTPTECERLQGFPDGWTDTGQADSHRYRQLGNAVAVPVVEWIARRIVLALP